MKDNSLDALRHSTAHLLAAAVYELYGDVKLAIGPSIENGFYYDIDFGEQKISEADLPKIEKKMRDLIGSWQGFEKIMLSPDEAKKEYKGNEYKEELIDQFAGDDKKAVAFYKSVGSSSSYFGGEEYRDLCKGGHVENPSEEIKHFKLLSVAGAYWRGDEKNPMLTRIYGTVWPTQDELDNYLNMLEEAKKRDHRVIGPKLELFMFHETSPGMPYWLPKGVILYNELINFWRDEHYRRGYQEIVSPILNKKELYVTSGHYDHYWSEMFVANTEDGEYGVKAMNCPNAHIVYASKKRSYREFPLRLGDTDSLHRFERSGTLNGLLRVREFRQDDAHIYVTEDMIESEYKEVFEIVERFYSIFDMKYSFRLGTRDRENFMGEVSQWNKAESILKKILEESGIEYSVAEGDGAFYGPKVDILMKDALRREWQMGTVQLDFQQPQRFGLKYSDKDGKEKTPVAIHRVIYGSLERFVGILIEHFGGAFPLWISPVQVKLLSVSESHVEYASALLKELQNAGVRAELDSSDRSLGKKIALANQEKPPYIGIIGDEEVKSGTLTLKNRVGEQSTMKIPDALIKLNNEIEQKLQA